MFSVNIFHIYLVHIQTFCEKSLLFSYIKGYHRCKTILCHKVVLDV